MKKTLCLIVLMLIFVLSACSPAAVAATEPKATTPVPATPAPTTEAAITEIKVDAADFSYNAPATIGAGWVRVILTNSGAEAHHVQLLHLNDGVTVQQFEDALEQAEGPALALTKQVGGVGAIHPGGTASAVINLPAGEYVLVCFIPSPGDHVAHHAKGMVRSLSVKATGGTLAAEPKAGLTVHMKDFTYDLPDALPSGPLTIRVENDGPEPHELNILKLEGGKTANDVLAFLNGAGGPPPFVPVGGINGLDSGVTGYAEINLTAGTYVAICNIPSPKAEGHPHSALGMIKQFSVGASGSVQSKFPGGRFVRLDNDLRALQFNSNGTWVALNGAEHLAEGTYSVKDDLYTEESNNTGCTTPKQYKYTFDGSQLKFTPVQDPSSDTCDGRKDDFNPTRTWMLTN